MRWISRSRAAAALRRPHMPRLLTIPTQTGTSNAAFWESSDSAAFERTSLGVNEYRQVRRGHRLTGGLATWARLMRCKHPVLVPLVQCAKSSVQHIVPLCCLRCWPQEVYTPPYLFRAGRPEHATPLPPAWVAYGSTFTVGYSGAANITGVAWVEPGGTTHNHAVSRTSCCVPRHCSRLQRARSAAAPGIRQVLGTFAGPADGLHTPPPPKRIC